MVGLRDLSEWRDATEEREFISFEFRGIMQTSFTVGPLRRFLSKFSV
jgi:hypothetical protein